MKFQNSGTNEQESARISFLGVGIQKAGTTWLDRCLRAHPQVYLAGIKELHYWNAYFNAGGSSVEKQQNRILGVLKLAVERHLRKGGVLEQMPRSTVTLLAALATQDYTPELYPRLFNSAGGKECVGEISPDYALLEPDHLRELKGYLGSGLKIVVSYRHPVSRAWSACRYFMRLRKNVNLSEYNDEKIVRLVLKENTGWLRISDKRSRYSEIHQNFSDVFEHLHPILFDDIVVHPHETLQQLCNFLGVEYRDSFFGGFVGQAVNADPSPAKIPEQVREFLENRYSAELNFLFNLFPGRTIKL